MDKDSRYFWLAVGVLVVVFSYMFYSTYMFGKEFANIIVPFLLGNCIGAIANFVWGSSKGSEEKTKIMAAESKQIAKDKKEEEK